MISIKNLTLLFAVLLMGLCLVSSVSAMDIDDSGSLTVSNDLSDASVSSGSVDDVAGVSSGSVDDVAGVSSDDGDVESVSSNSDEVIASDSNLNDLESQDSSKSNVSSENEVLSTDNTMEDSDLKYNAKSKDVLTASSQSQTTKVKTILKGSSSTIYRYNNYVLTLTDSKGKALSGQRLSYNIGGKIYNLTTDSKGSTYLKINLKEGKYRIVCSYAGNNNLLPSGFALTLNVLKNPNAFTINEIEKAATNVKAYVSKNKKLPKTVTVGSKKLKISEFSYLASKAILNLNSNNYGNIILIKGISNVKSSSVSLKATVYKAQYLNVAKNVVSRVNSKKVPPSATVVRNNANKAIGKANFNLTTFAFAKILDFHKSNKYLPNYCSFNSSVFKKKTSLKSTTLKGSSSTLSRGTNYVLTLVDGNGKAIKGQKLSYRVKGKTYTLTTDSKGSTYLKINLKEGKYKMVCSYAGSKVYKPSKRTVTLTVLKSPKKFSIAQIETAAAYVKNYVSKNKKLPKTVKVGSSKLKISEFSYLASKAIINLNSNKKGSIALLRGISDGSSSSYSLKSKIYKSQYVALAKRSYSKIGSKKVPSSYLAAKDSSNKAVKVNYNLYTFAFAKILDFHKSNKYLPNYCTFESSAFAASVKKTTNIKSSSSSISKGGSYSVSLTDKKGAGIANQKVTFSVAGKSYEETTNSKGVASLKMNLKAGTYSVVASYKGSSSYKASELSKTLTINNANRFNLNDIETAANNVKNYVNSHKQLPNTVTVANKKLSISQFSYLMAKSICNINAGNYNSITLPTMSSCNSAGDNIKSTVYKEQYLNLTKRVVAFDESNKISPVYARVYSSSGSSVGKAEFKLYTYAFSKILTFHKNNKYLPNYCTFESSVFNNQALPSGISTQIKYNASQFKNGLNEKNTETNISKYLVGTGKSVITPSIKNLATKLTKGLTSKESKALAIYKYVRDEIDYSYYADSRYGASGTLSAGSGNCVDQASLFVALCRASGVPARYAHAQGCTFSSGLVTGHVWAQVLVNGIWYSADATSVRNNLGNIANWNTNSYYSLNKYVAVPF